LTGFTALLPLAAMLAPPDSAPPGTIARLRAAQVERRLERVQPRRRARL